MVVLPLLALALGSQLASVQEPSEFNERWTQEAKVYRLAGPSVVSINLSTVRRVRHGNGRYRNAEVAVGQGTGVVIDAEGFVITNAHVAVPDLEGLPMEAIKMEVAFATEFGGKKYPVEVLTYDREQDLALLKIVGPGPFPAVVLGSSSDLIIGEKVIAIGAPFGNSHSITSGILSGKHRKVTVNIRRGVHTFVDLLQTDAAINPGNSGGPLLNVYGHLIGINVATNQRADGLGFAIPADKVRETLANSLLDFGRSQRFWSGLSVEGSNALALQLKSVHPRGPASAAGLQAGDQILSVDGIAVTSAAGFSAAMLKKSSGQDLVLEVNRQGKHEEIQFALMKPKGRDGFALLGFELARDSILVRGGFFPERENVLRITEVYADSPAAALGLRPDDVLIAVGVKGARSSNGWVRVRRMEEVVSLIRSPDFRADEENLWIVRGKDSFYGQLIPDDPEFGD